MMIEKRVLFGTDGSDFARQALISIGDLMKTGTNQKAVLFHGVAAPDRSLFPDCDRHETDGVEKQREHRLQAARKVLEQAQSALASSGFEPNSISTILDQESTSPSEAMLKLAAQEGIDTVAVARWGKSTISRQVMGSVTYRLSQMADDVALWVIDPRVSSRNVLIGLVGAPISGRVVDYAVRHFAHLKERQFTLMHVIPPIPPQYWEADNGEGTAPDEKHKRMVQWMKEYSDRVKEAAEYGRQKLIEAGVPARNVIFKLQPQKSGIARDIISEMKSGDHGILVIGRKGYKDIKDFSLGSKALKMLLKGSAFIVCLVN